MGGFIEDAKLIAELAEALAVCVKGLEVAEERLAPMKFGGLDEARAVLAKAREEA